MDRRRENFKNALFLLFMVELRNKVLKRENKAKGKPDFDKVTRDLEKKSMEVKELGLESKKPGGLSAAQSQKLKNVIKEMEGKREKRNKDHLYDPSGKGISIKIELTFTETAIHWDLVNPDPLPASTPRFGPGPGGGRKGISPTASDPELHQSLTGGLSNGTYMLYCGD